MKAFITLVLTVLALNLTPSANAQQPENEDVMTTYFFIRHAEKDLTDPANKDPQLSAEGLARVQKWVALFKDTPLDLVYSTDFHRTRQTAGPIAASKNLEVKIYDTQKIDFPAFLNQTKGKTVLVLGHSNTIPNLVNSLLKEQKHQEIDEAESGSLFVVSLSSSGQVSSQLLYIN